MTEATIDRAQVRFHWMTNWWDGPLAGLAYYQERLHYFDMLEDTGGRLYRLYYLSDEQIAIWQQKHAAFRALVGTHWDYDADGKRDPNGQVIHQSHEDAMRYYALVWPQIELDESAVVGVFAE